MNEYLEISIKYIIQVIMVTWVTKRIFKKEKY